MQVLCALGRADGKATEPLRQLVASIRRHAPESGLAFGEGWEFEHRWNLGAFYVVGKLYERLRIRKIVDTAAKGESEEALY